MSQPRSAALPERAGTAPPTILRQVWYIAWPVVVASMLDATEGMVDIYMVGKLGPAAISAVGMSRQIVFVMMVVMMSISTGTRTLVAQLYGANRRDDVGRTARQALMMGVLFSIGLTLIGLLITRPALLVLGARGEVLAYAAPYLRLYIGGSIFMVLNYIMSAIFGGAGDTRTPLKISTVIICLKIIATYGLVFGAWGVPQMGVSGAALGTILSRCAGCLVAAWILTSGKGRVRMRWSGGTRLDRKIIGSMLRIGVPAGFTGFFRNGARILFYRLVAWTAAPTASLAALTIGLQVRLVAIMPALAFQVAATALVGQRLGARQVEEAGHFGMHTIRLCMTLIVGSGILICVFAHDIIGIFTAAPDVIDTGYVMLWFFAVAQTFSALSIVSGGVLSGGGETRPPLYYTIVSQWMLMLPLAYLLAFPFGLDILGIWIAWLAGGALQGALTFRRFLKGTWKRTVV